MSADFDLVIVGAGPAGLASAHHARRAGLRPLVLEAGERPGGKVRTLVEDGFVVECGPQGWLDREPAVEEVCGHLGLEPLKARPAAAERFLMRKGRLLPVPMGPGAFLRSPLLSLRGRLRVLAEPFVRRNPAPGDETVHAFAARRIGREAAEVLVDAMVGGVFAGDSRRISLPAVFPVMQELEAEYGSLFKGLIARRKAARRAGRKPGGGPAGPGGTLCSFPRGMGVLMDALAEACGRDLRCGVAVDGLEPGPEGWVVRAGGEVVARAPRVLLTCPARATASILHGLEPGLAGVAAEIPEAHIAAVTAAWPRERVGHPCHGFGFLAPRCEGFRPLGVLFLHDIFEGHAPPDRVVLRVMLGGAHDPGVVDLDDAALTAAALGPLRPLLGLRGEPERLWVHRVRHAIPQYTLGHLARVQAFEEAAARHPGLHLAGDSLFGIGVNPAFKRARELQEALAAARPAPAAATSS